ncbi:hypothetical protein IFM89_032876 [Coptis chinensis]|uniref:non-specific serine/threonine protein kinase n=1 Tax=Coptis chinensis TaxID=261450 RepID=A0A835M7T6_9MAGN|nr:hypothetical protein IFM89_032876 [Coptis chinensis]
MHVMRRLKSIASGRSSVSDPGGDSKRVKVDQEQVQNNKGESLPVEKNNMVASTSQEVVDASTSGTSSKTGVDQLPKELNEMRIKDDSHDDNKDLETTFVNGNGTETGQIIATTMGGRNGQPKQTISYMAERVVGTGSFGVVFQAKCLETGEAVAIKKVLQDKRYKNRELQIMRLLEHPNIVQLKHFFFSTTDKDEVYLNLVLEYVSETVYRVEKHYSRMSQYMPILFVQLYTYQVNPHTHQLKICDFGSAKKLVPGEPNISYICSRYYRAPELIFGATEYTTAIDMWSVGCVLAELLLGQPLFPGESGVDQLVEVIKVLGTPTREEIKCMNPNYTEYKFPQIKAHPWHKVFHKRMPHDAVDLVSRLLQYSPNLRCSAVRNLRTLLILEFSCSIMWSVKFFWSFVFLKCFYGLLQLEACAHSFFDDLRDPNLHLPSGRPLPPLFDFTPEELAGASEELLQRLIPEHAKK